MKHNFFPKQVDCTSLSRQCVNSSNKSEKTQFIKSSELTHNRLITGKVNDQTGSKGAFELTRRKN